MSVAAELTFRHGNKSYVIFVGVLLSSDDLSSVCMGEKCNPCCTCECRSPTNYSGSNQWQCHKCGCEMQPMKISWDVAWKLGLFQPTVLEVFRENQLHPYQNSWGAHIFPYIDSYILNFRITTPICHRQAPVTHYFEEGRSVSASWVLFNVHYSHLGTPGQVHVICEHVYHVVLNVKFWIGIVGDIFLSPHKPPDRFIAQEFFFSGNSSIGASWMFSSHTTPSLSLSLSEANMNSRRPCSSTVCGSCWER